MGAPMGAALVAPQAEPGGGVNVGWVTEVATRAVVATMGEGAALVKVDPVMMSVGVSAAKMPVARRKQQVSSQAPFEAPRCPAAS